VSRVQRDDSLNVLARIVTAEERIEDGDPDEAHAVLRGLEEELAVAEAELRRAA
jgi:hypothetical protein